MEQSEDLILKVSELVDACYLHWNDFDKLKDVGLKLIDFQLQLASQLASAEVSENQAFLSYTEGQYRQNISIARAKTKSATTTKVRYEFEASKGLLNFIMLRLKHLQYTITYPSPRKGTEKPTRPGETSDAPVDMKGRASSSKAKTKQPIKSKSDKED